MTASISVTFTAALMLGGILQVFECITPEVAQLAQAFRTSAVQSTGPVAPFGEQAGLTQDAQVLRNGRPGDVWEMSSDLTRRPFAVAYQAQDCLASGIGQGVEHGAIEHAFI